MLTFFLSCFDVLGPNRVPILSLSVSPAFLILGQEPPS